ncbi:MAG: M15 family metallopeptidase [Bacteroidales bacterium]|nr:M15 family metallopeptidase [Bacteroidales bacterium]
MKAFASLFSMVALWLWSCSGSPSVDSAQAQQPADTVAPHQEALYQNVDTHIHVNIHTPVNGPAVRHEFYRDTVPYVIEIEPPQPQAKGDTAFSADFQRLYAGKMDGSLLNRTVRYVTPSASFSIRISAQGDVYITKGSNEWVRGHLYEDENLKRKLHVSEASDSLMEGRDASFYLNGQQITVPGLGVDMYYDGLEMDFINLKNFSHLLLFDIRYNTDNNFAHARLYPEPIAWMRYVAARDFLDAARHFADMGFRIKVFDTYRPRDVQYKMWEIVPDARFVANPNTGSIHNRGGAADITLVDADGNDLDMGTDFDFFGPEAYPSCTTISAQAQKNRKLLSDNITKFHFKAITSEWWHFSHTTARSFQLSNFIPKEYLDL